MKAPTNIARISTRWRESLVERPRVAARIAAAARHPLALLVAPAGSGKTVALNEYLASLPHPFRYFDASSLDARDLLRSARDCARAAPTIAIDSFEKLQPLDDVARQLIALIEATKAQTSWILASRSSARLPISSWLAYGVASLPLCASDLEFTAKECEALARLAGPPIDETVLSELTRLTGGWPALVAIALPSMQVAGKPNWSLAREMCLDFIEQQTLATLEPEQRALLECAVVLPTIDPLILERAGFPGAAQTLDAIRHATGMLEEEDGHCYALHPLLRDLLRDRITRAGLQSSGATHAKAAAGLEMTGNVEAALDAYIVACSRANVLRLLERDGFDLIERGRVDVVKRSIDALDDDTRRNHPRILALRGVIQSFSGKSSRAEFLLRRSLVQAKEDRELSAFASLRLAPLFANYGGDITALLIPLAEDSLQNPRHRAEAYSLLAATRAVSGQFGLAMDAMEQVEALLMEVDLDSARAKILQRIGVAAIYAGEPERARWSLSQAIDLASELGTHTVVSRAASALSNLMSHYYDDIDAQYRYAQMASDAAVLSGDAFDLRTALLQLLAAEMRLGNIVASAALEDRISILGADSSRDHVFVPLRALRFASSGRFEEAHRALSVCWNKVYHDFERVLCGAQCALFQALSGCRDESIALISTVNEQVDAIGSDKVLSVRYVAMARLFSCLAELVNGRTTHARKLLRALARDPDPIVQCSARIADRLVAGYPRLDLANPDPAQALDVLTRSGYADVVLILQAADRELAGRSMKDDYRELTPAELSVLSALSEGASPKEIASRSGRSVFTVRAHIANLIAKLDCNGRAHAISVARRKGLIP
jgi:ATP/maltotriose-dependent transcriptional regulator MalT